MHEVLWYSVSRRDNNVPYSTNVHTNDIGGRCSFQNVLSCLLSLIKDFVPVFVSKLVLYTDFVKSIVAYLQHRNV